MGAALAARWAAALERAVDRALADPARPAQVRDLATRLDALEARRVRLAAEVSATRQGLDALTAARDATAAPSRLERLRMVTSQHEALDAALRDLRERVRAVADALSAAEQRLAEAGRVATEAAERATSALGTLPAGTIVAEADPVPASTAVCRVPGCSAPVKARGLCGRHYGRWHRGRLPGWVFADGRVDLGTDGWWRVDPALSAEPVGPGGGDTLVHAEDGRSIPARRIR